MEYIEKQFDLPAIDGLSEKQIEIHLALYRGYVAHINRLYETLERLMSNSEMSYAVSEVRRRIGFELGGIYNHEVYFGALVGGANDPADEFSSAVSKQYGSFDNFKDEIKKIATGTRGIGWVIVVYDKNRTKFHIIWVSDHEIGQVPLPTIYALDMWEHAYMADYVPAEKSKYVDAYITATNWQVVSQKFSSL